MWGHMPETVTAVDGTVFKRPLLLKELSSTSGRTAIAEDNEDWAQFTQTQATSTSSNGCGSEYVPSQAGLESLYEANRGNAMKTVQGAGPSPQVTFPARQAAVAWNSVTSRPSISVQAPVR